MNIPAFPIIPPFLRGVRGIVRDLLYQKSP
ncbi:hypothetical protein CWATWH0402_1052 [Crocosphaera watsonii WH 0402]|uniref:Uncharacterized protein n=1 Tax=Crocosphaera watsonii WH 0402 TaxID=1284629 RepID=T2JZ77_CROWT|nr:hypothetical protein CWATWH0402_1052 [Crocosphaera watsonii WH 0402]